MPQASGGALLAKGRRVSKGMPFTLLPFPRPGRDRDFRFPRKTRERAILRILRAGFGPVSFFAPELSARCAERLFRNPPRSSPLPRERDTLSHGRLERQPFRDGWLTTWTFGAGAPVLLAHGWGGHAGRLSRFVEPLVRSGRSVIAFDAPGHGLSSGKESSMPDFVAAIEELARSRGPLAGIVGHSLGAAAAAYAVRAGLPAARLVLLAPPANPESYAAKFAHYFRIPPDVRDGMKRRLEQRYRLGWRDLRLDAALGYAPARLLVLHDRADCRVPWKDGASIAAAWPGSELVTTRGLGHHKILRDAAVIRASVNFLVAGERPLAPGADATSRHRNARQVAVVRAG